jgi:hypothetical protein
MVCKVRHPSVLTGSTTGVSTISYGAEARSTTTSMKNVEDMLEAALDNMIDAEPPQPFALNYVLINDRIRGGQALVQVRTMIDACEHAWPCDV